MGYLYSSVLSTLISVLKFMYEHSEKKPGIDAVMMDFAHVMIEMMRFNTPFLNFSGTTRRCRIFTIA